MSIAPDSSKTGSPGGAGSGFWLGLLLLSLAVFGVNTGVSVWLGSRLTGAGATVVDLQGLAQQLDYQGRAALGGNVRAWREFKHTRARIGDTVTTLARQFAGEPRVNRALARTAATWAPLDRRAGQIIAAEPAVLALASSVDHFLQHAALLRGQLHALALARVDAGASAAQVYAVLQQEEQLATLVRQVAAVRAGGAAAASGLQRDLHAFAEGLDGLRRQTGGGRADSAAQAALAQVQASWQQLQPDLTGLLSAVQPLLAAQAAGAALAQGSGRMVEDSRRLYTAFSSYDSQRDPRVFPNFWVGVVSGSLLLVAIIGFVWSFLRARQREQDIRYQTQVESNIRNQNAIMQLLDEISSLAEGDLTVNATVTEDMTGAIADAINYAVDELRKLVTTINGTSVQVAASAQETQATALQLAEAAGRQSDQINSASERINEIAASIEQVSQNSTESADVAQNSVQIATTGAGVVRQTIKGMDQIRDQIQETSKRIKRLGESSQEIGSIVELINDISEQTNILALNAAVQAASAGEAGRGFAVVADEVQRLAERTSGAIRRIEGLVQTIQADTNEAVSSMEQTTAEVVSGARLAENAGTALTEIERVSNALNDLIKSISQAARQQAGAAADITRTMDVVRRIAAQTSSGAGQTSESIGRLAQLAADLRRSVADFKLPA